MTLALVNDENKAAAQDAALDRVFFALSDPVRRAILGRLDQSPALVSELAEPFDMSLQAVSRHIQVLVRAGLVTQARTGRIARCNLDAAPLYDAAVWLNHYTKYWQQSFDALAEMVKALPPAEPAKSGKAKPKPSPKPRPKPTKGKRK